MADDAEAQFDRLWRENAATVLRYAHRRVPHAEVDDVVAETFVVAWRRLPEVPTRPLPWLLGVARGVSANMARSARRRDALDRQVLSEVQPVVPDTADRVAGRLPEQVHLAALRRLPDADRELLTLLAWDELSHEEAAEAMGCSRGALRVRLHRARRRFRGLLADLATVDAPVSPGQTKETPGVLTSRARAGAAPTPAPRTRPGPRPGPPALHQRTGGAA